MIYPVNIKNYSDLLAVCNKIQTDPRAFAYLSPKFNVLHFYGEHVDYRAAAFLKQELLARGGDTVVTKHVIDGKTDFSDVLLMGTPSQLKSLIEKLKSMDCWGLKQLREEFSRAFANFFVTSWSVGEKLKLDNDTKLMAIINLTPDSFHEASRVKENDVLSTAEKFLEQGAEILDIGAESTRPGFEPVEAQEEIARLIPALKILRREFPKVVISVDTYKSETARAAVDEGADIINDISGFELDTKMLELISKIGVPYVLSHFQKEPCENILSSMLKYFDTKITTLCEVGFKRENLILDPGLGFGKTLEDNFTILKNLEALKIFGLPILVGHSRKRFTGKNLFATVALSGLLYGRANILRVHDVEENLKAIEMAKNLR